MFFDLRLRKASHVVPGYAGVTGPGPQVLRPIPDLEETEGRQLRYQISADTFIDPNGRTLTFSVMVSGVPAAWLRFHPLTRTFSGKVPRGCPDLVITIRASNRLGQRAEDTFVLRTPTGRRSRVAADRMAATLAERSKARPLSETAASAESTRRHGGDTDLLASGGG
ncbi:MAG TPA: putative Ig domain-containing protein [Azospirillaceae bacterium]|nr:putative Ig domain-containing protein [Azospirillaceae bacterium]